MRYLTGKRLTTHEKNEKEKSRETFCLALAHEGVGRAGSLSWCKNFMKHNFELSRLSLLAGLDVMKTATAFALAKPNKMDSFMKTKLKLHLLLLMLLSLSGVAHAQGTAISYQGRLNDGGSPATGLYDFTFHIFDAEVAGTDLAGPLRPLPYDAVPVTNGLFNVSLDFGPDIFSGPARWLEISVRTNGVGDPSLLSPRTPLLPTPYAIFAGKAGSVVNGTVTADQLHTGGLPPTPGQFLSYKGGNLVWSDPGVAVGDVWTALDGNAYYNGGKVGIGTTSPISKLHAVSSASDPYPPRLQSPGTTTFGAGWDFYHGAVGKAYVGVPDSAAGFGGGELLLYGGAGTKVSMWSAGIRRLTLDTVGNVGIGTATPASKLTVFTPSGGVTKVGMEHTDGTIRLGTYVAPGLGGLLGTVTPDPLSFFYNNNFGYPNMTIGDGYVSMASGPGFVTVGTPNGESGTSIKRGINRADVRFDGATLKLVAGPGFGPPSSFSGIAVSTNGNVGIGTTTPSRTLEVFGDFLARDVSCRVLTIRGGADVAEPFAMPERIAKGSVVVIDDAHPGKLKLSAEAYDTRVAGIVSGANGINPGIALHQEGVVEGGQNVALSGRVYVQADAAFGAIKPGDLLTTSDTPGHAMKVTEHGKAQGAILGKAMSGLKDGKGMVLVLVTLQ
jgi:hypothetical protein